MSAMNTIGINTPTNLTLTPRNPLKTSSSQVLSLGNQTLMNWAGEQGDAVPTDLIPKVLASHANP
jgi:hypothetical protein